MNPKGLKKDEYDVIIIGAGIGGLVCGCYLAKAGLKVFIVEQHYKAGGCCQSFTRNGFTFEAGALENLREGGQFRKIIGDLDIEKKVKIIRSNPSIILIMPDYKFRIKNDTQETISDLQGQFPHQAQQIQKFFDYILKTSFIELYLRAKDIIFEDILERYFTDIRLKSILKALTTQIGIPSNKLSTLTAAIHFREFIFDSGYYPIGGLQVFSDAFVDRFKELGGTLLFSNLVTQIKVNKNEAIGVILQDKTCISSKYVVSNADATQTFLSLVGEEKLKKDFIIKLKNLVPSISLIAVYLGINKNLRQKLDNCYELCYVPNYKEDNPWDKMRLEKNPLDANLYCYLSSFQDSTLAPPNNESISIGLFTTPLNKDYWDKYKSSLADKMIKRMEDIIPNLSKNILRREIATPPTVYKYTLNRDGAIRGWAASISQITKTIIPQRTHIKNLFLVGHWVSLPSGEYGLPMAAYTGAKAAKTIIREIKK